MPPTATGSALREAQYRLEIIERVADRRKSLPRVGQSQDSLTIDFRDRGNRAGHESRTDRGLARMLHVVTGPSRKINRSPDQGLPVERRVARDVNERLHPRNGVGIIG